MSMAIGTQVFTRLDKGQIVFKLSDGSLVVEFDWGGGKIFRPEELFGVSALEEDSWSNLHPQIGSRRHSARKTSTSFSKSSGLSLLRKSS